MMYGGSARKNKRNTVVLTITWTELAWLWAVLWMYKNLTKMKVAAPKGYHWMKQPNGSYKLMKHSESLLNIRVLH